MNAGCPGRWREEVWCKKYLGSKVYTFDDGLDAGNGERADARVDRELTWMDNDKWNTGQVPD